MIRIDLGKNVETKTEKGSIFSKLFPKKKGAKAKGKSKKKSKIKIGDLIFFAVVLVVAYAPHLIYEQFKSSLIEKLEQDVKTAESALEVSKKESGKLAPYQKELDSYQQQQQIVQQKIEVVKDLLSRRSAQVSILDALGQALPARAWLTSLEITPSNSGNLMVRIVGQAYRNEEISDYLDKLTDSIYLSDVKLEDLTTATDRSDSKLEVKEFKMSAIPKGIQIRKKASVADPAANSGTNTPKAQTTPAAADPSAPSKSASTKSASNKKEGVQVESF